MPASGSLDDTVRAGEPEDAPLADRSGRARARRSRVRRGDSVASRIRLLRASGAYRSERPARTGWTHLGTARLWHRLIHGRGYRRYGAHGTDWGSTVTTFMALDEPEPLLGIHLGNLDVQSYLGPGPVSLSSAERNYRAQFERWGADDRGYGAIQSTRP